jgi:ribosomal protein L44E
MVELTHHYCKDCQKKTSHVLQTYYDGSVVRICLVCRSRELTRKGFDYRRYERIINNEQYKKELFPLVIYAHS